MDVLIHAWISNAATMLLHSLLLFFLLNEPLLLSLSMFLDCFEPWATLMA